MRWTAGVLAAVAAGCGLGTDLAAGINVEVWLGDQVVADAVVDLYSADGTQLLAADTTGLGGTVGFSGLDPGGYEVGVTIPDSVPVEGEQSERTSISVFGGQVLTLSFDFTRDPDITVVHLTADTTFVPAEVTIAPGQSVRWFNATDVTHTVTPDGHTEWPAATLDGADASFTHEFTAADTFPYYSEPFLGDGMTGTITVVQ